MLILLVTIPTDEEQTTASYSNITELIKAQSVKFVCRHCMHIRSYAYIYC